jgi:hypothetical protein
MTENERAIEEAAKAIWVERWGSDEGWERVSRKSHYMEQAQAVFAVFEEARTPADQREQWARLSLTYAAVA